MKKKTPIQVFSCSFCEIIINFSSATAAIYERNQKLLTLKIATVKKKDFS